MYNRKKVRNTSFEAYSDSVNKKKASCAHVVCAERLGQN